MEEAERSWGEVGGGLLDGYLSPPDISGMQEGTGKKGVGSYFIIYCKMLNQLFYPSIAWTSL